jgi:hypothetical protein
MYFPPLPDQRSNKNAAINRGVFIEAFCALATLQLEDEHLGRLTWNDLAT